MKIQLVDILVCPKCHGKLSGQGFVHNGDEEIASGNLVCGSCGARYPIVRGVPRFVDPDNYTASFGFQWNRFAREQLDSANGHDLSAKRFYAETDWKPEWLAGKWIVELGCGAGRFLDIASQFSCQVVGIDMSSAVDAAAISMAGRKNVHIIQASAYELPLLPGTFDGGYCIGVVQHTPFPEKTLRAFADLIKVNGKVAVSIYERKPWTFLNAKYLIRPITRRLDKRVLLFFIQATMPILFPLTEALYRIPILGKLFRFVIPVADYTIGSSLPFFRRYQCAVLDTFDMLSPTFDQPQTEREVRSALMEGHIMSIERLNNSGVNLVGIKK